MSKVVRDELHQCALNMLQQRLSRCTEPQRQLFARVYPKLTQDNIVDAIDLCDRTIRKNEAGRATQETSVAEELRRDRERMCALETPADLVGALQDRAHVDAGPLRTGADTP